MQSASCGESVTYRVEVKVLATVGAGVGDLSFVDEVVKGVTLARLQTDFRFEIKEPGTFDEAEDSFSSWLTERQKLKRVLVVTVGGGYISLVEGWKCQFNGRHLLHLDQNLSECDGLISATFRTFAPSFLAGVASMQISGRKTAAVIGGMYLPSVNEFIDGYRAGVEFAGGTLTAVEYLADDFSGFSDPDKAEEVAKRLYAEADVIIPVAGGSSIGVIRAARDKEDLEEQDRRYVVGVDTDQSVHGVQVVIGSVTKNLKKVVSSTILDLDEGRFVPGAINLDIEEQGAGFQPNTMFADRFQEEVADSYAAAIEAERSYHGSR